MNLIDSLSHRHRQKNKKNALPIFHYKKAYIFISIFASLLILSLGFVGVEAKYRDSYFPNVAIENINATSKNASDLKPPLEEKAKNLLNTAITIESNNNKLAEISYSDLGVSYNIDSVLDQAWQVGHEKTFASKFSALKAIFVKQNFVLTPTINQEKYQKSIADFTGKVNQNAKNATLKVENGEIKVVPAEDGNIIVIIDLENNLNQAIAQRITKIEASYTTDKAKITDSQLGEAQEQTQNYLSNPVILAFEDTTYEATQKEIGNWIKFNEVNSQVKAELDSDKIGEFIDLIAKKINVKAVDKVIDATSGLTVSEGRDGQAIDRQNAITNIINALNKNLDREVVLDVSITPRGEKTTYSNYTLGQYPGKYIEMDLSNQKLYQIDGNTLLGAYIISSGKAGMYTPVGTFSILNKDIKAYSATYGLYMPYWMAIVGSKIGIHALPEWPNGTREGESHLGTPVSHGCVRLSDAGAKTVYDWADIGTPVVIH